MAGLRRGRNVGIVYIINLVSLSGSVSVEKREMMRFLRRIFESLRAKIFLAILLVSLLAGISVGGASYVIARSIVKERVERNISAVGRDVQRILEDVWIPTLEREMQVMAEVMGRVYAMDPSLEGIKAVLGEERIKVSGFKRLNVFLPNGFFVAGTDSAYGGRFEEKIIGVQPGETVVVPFRRVGDAPETEYLMTVGAPILKGGKVIAVLAGDLTPEGIGREIGSLTVGISGEVYLVNSEGQLITLPPRAGEESSLEILGEPLRTEGVQRVSRGESGVAEYLNYAGRKVLGGYFYLSGTGWGIMVEEDAREAFADLATLRNFIIYIVAGLALVSMLSSVLMARRVTDPLRRLQRAVEKLGLGDLHYRVEVRGGEELQSLASSFNRMADALQVSYEMLEEKVRRRTAELRTLNEMIFSLRRSRSPDEIFQKALQAGMEFTSYEMGWCYLSAGDEFTLLYSRCPAEAIGRVPESFGLGEGLLGEIAGKGEAFFLDSVRKSASPDVYQLFPEGSLALLPLRSAKGILGLICMASSETKHLSEETKRTLAALADEVGIALENAFLYRELQANVEELEQANRELRTLDEMKSNFISAITHELKQPLSLISGYAQTIRDYYESLTYEEEMRCLQVILERTEFLSSLVNELLDLTMLEMGRIRLHKEECDFEELARKVASQYGVRNPAQPIVVDFPEDFPLVTADVRRMEQVLANLVSNAVKFSEGKGEIRIQGSVKGDRVQVKVMDEGIGIDPSKVKREFDRFYQVDASPRRPYSGVGLGLFICRELVEAHGGRIWAENRPGGGAMVTFEIPRGRSGDGRKEDEQVFPADAAGKGHEHDIMD